MENELRSFVIKVSYILKKYGAKEIYLFGSAAWDQSHELSDLDIAISGLPPEKFFAAMGEAGDAINIPLDLIDLDENTPFTRYLRQEGELIRVD
ncbi:MAG: nucleotidyltransferase family protein [bacterium]